MKRLAVYFTLYCAGVVTTETYKLISKYVKQHRTVKGPTKEDTIGFDYKSRCDELIDNLLKDGKITHDEHKKLMIALMYFDCTEFGKDVEYKNKKN